jgi:hypothetical protein
MRTGISLGRLMNRLSLGRLERTVGTNRTGTLPSSQSAHIGPCQGPLTARTGVVEMEESSVRGRV